MCGIVGYIGTNKPVPILLDGLKKLKSISWDASTMEKMDMKT